jgi:hypothetical protein
MPADSVHHVYIERHNSAKSIAFCRGLGFQLDEERGTSGVLGPIGDGPYTYPTEVPAHRTPAVELCLSATDETAPQRPVEVIAPFAATHWGTREMAVRDPDGRLFKLEKR